MEQGWKDPLSGKEYVADDPRLIGTGNPPAFPMKPGAGRCPMTPVWIAQADADQKRADNQKPGAEKTFSEDYVEKNKPVGP